MKTKFKLFVVFHNDIYEDYYDEDLISHLVFINVNPANPNLDRIKNLGYKVINQYEFENFSSLGKQYAESEVIYNIYRNQYLIKDVENIGFIQYDMNTHHLSINELNRLLKSYSHIAFDEHDFKSEYRIGYLMDEHTPNTWIGKGKNCFISILEDYNKYYNVEYSIKDLLSKKINLCCTFCLEKDLYLKMMSFISSVIESGKLDIYDTEGRYRMQGGLLERYFGVWLTINSTNYFHRPIEHVYNTTVATNKKKLISKIFSLFKKQ